MYTLAKNTWRNCFLQRVISAGYFHSLSRFFFSLSFSLSHVRSHRANAFPHLEMQRKKEGRKKASKATTNSARAAWRSESIDGHNERDETALIQQYQQQSCVYTFFSVKSNPLSCRDMNGWKKISRASHDCCCIERKWRLSNRETRHFVFQFSKETVCSDKNNEVAFSSFTSAFFYQKILGVTKSY